MALPSSGVLTLNDIQTEFGGTNPIGLSEYYRGGGLVPDTAGNAGIPTSGVISVTDFYGAANSIALNFATHGSGASGSSFSIGTARSTRMVHVSGYSTSATITSVTIGGITATVLNHGSTGSNPGQSFQAWAKVPTGTTATITTNGTTTMYASTFDTVNSGAADTGSATGAGTTTTFTFTAANPGVCFWGGNNGIGPSSPSTTMSLATNNPDGINYLYQLQSGAGGPSAQAAYSETSTTVNQTFSVTRTGAKTGSSGAVGSIFYAN